MRRIIILSIFFPYIGYANTISCHFDKFHQVNHEMPDMNGYFDINQSLEIISGKTTEDTLKLDGLKRAVNSKNWVLLEPKSWDTYSITYAGEFGELLTIGHKLEKNNTGLKVWYNASLISSTIITTHTSLGKCLISSTKQTTATDKLMLSP